MSISFYFCAPHQPVRSPFMWLQEWPCWWKKPVYTATLLVVLSKQVKSPRDHYCDPHVCFSPTEEECNIALWKWSCLPGRVCSHSGVVASSTIEGLLHKHLFLDDCGIVSWRRNWVLQPASLNLVRVLQETLFQDINQEMSYHWDPKNEHSSHWWSHVLEQSQYSCLEQ